MYRTTLILLIAILCCIRIYAQDKGAGTFSFETRRDSHVAKIVFRTKSFNRSEHKVIQGADQCVKIDGHEPLGTDCGMPSVELTSMRLYFDGREIPIPRRLYADSYQPALRKDYSSADYKNHYFALRIGDDLQSVFAFMSGGDGAGSYQVLWVLRKDGKHSRFSGSCGDCGFIDFKSGFFSGQ
jgi:hypothetical protein